MTATDLLDLPRARLAIRVPATDTSRDADLAGDYIPAVTPIVEDVVGPVIKRDFDEWQDGGAPMVKLDHAPVAAVALVEESYGTFVRTLTAQPLNSGGSFDAYGYTVDLGEGILFRRASGRSIAFPVGRQNVHVVYTAGVAADMNGIPRNIVLAARIILAQLWQADQQGYRQGGGGPQPDMVSTPSGFALPRRAYELLRGSEHFTGIA